MLGVVGVEERHGGVKNFMAGLMLWLIGLTRKEFDENEQGLT